MAQQTPTKIYWKKSQAMSYCRVCSELTDSILLEFFQNLAIKRTGSERYIIYVVFLLLKMTLIQMEFVINVNTLSTKCGYFGEHVNKFKLIYVR